MSLAVLADHMASKGRGPDSMLIHMSPHEVQGLQALAVKNGGSLTINPETGLPEAGFLDKLLPAVIGFGLNYFVPGLGTAVGGALGTSAAVGTGLAVGGFEALRTGDLGRGISAGLGAYGGAGLQTSLATAGGETLANQAAGQSYLSSYAPPGVLEGAGAGLSADMAYNLGQAGVVDAASTQATSLAQQAAAERIAAATPFEKLAAGASQATSSPAAMGQFAKDNFKYLASAAGPILADQAVKSNMPTTTTSPGAVRTFSYNPYDQLYTPTGNYEVPIKAADGGLMGMDDGGYNPGQLDFMQRSEPVVRMAVGGTPPDTTAPTGMSLSAAQADVGDIYRNVLGRDVDPEGMAYWSQQFATSKDPNAVYNDLLASAKQNTEIIRPNAATTFADASKDYTGYQSTDRGNIVDEWVRNNLGREPTDVDRQQQWYRESVGNMRTQEQAQDLYGQFKNYASEELGFQPTLDWMAASQLRELPPPPTPPTPGDGVEVTPIATTPETYAPPGTKNPYGNEFNPGDLTFNNDGTTTVTPNIPGRPYGGFTGMDQVRDAYTRGGGSLGYIPDTPETIEEFNEKYNTLTGGSKKAYDYLMGKSSYSPKPYTPTGEVMKPYAESVLGAPVNITTKQVLFDPATRTYKNNPDYIPVSYTDKGEKVYGLSGREIASGLSGTGATSDYAKWMKDNNVTHAQIAKALGISVAEAKKRYPSAAATTTDGTSSDTYYSHGYDGGGGGGGAAGGLMAMAGGGMAGQFDLGGYSDGGRLLRGPGDGVSDSIPATIGNKRPARLADGEFVVPARIVSELGNGSTEAGARKLYAMMDRVQKARRGTVGKGRVAKNSRSDKHLPA